MLVVVTCMNSAWSAEYFVAKNGSDSKDGSSLQNAFLTIQKGVDALNPGDTLTIAPGEYTQSAHRDNLGSSEKDTTIRAQRPGTVLLRGDVPLPPMRKVEGHQFVYATRCEQFVQAVNEIDTLMILQKVPNEMELDAAPNRFFYDANSKELFVSASDWKAATEHVYSASVSNMDGLYFSNAQRLVIEGLAFTGFNSTMPDRFHPPYRSRYSGMGAVWGLLLGDSQACIIRQCTAYLNGGGIGTECLVKPKQIGLGNLITQCVAYGNYSQLYPYESSGIGAYQSNNDELRDCYTYKNDGFGSRFYLTTFSPGKMSGIISWGNIMEGSPADIQIKASAEIIVDRCIALGFAQLHIVSNSIIPKNTSKWTDDNIFLTS